MATATLTELAIGLGIAGLFLSIGAGTWYQPTLFAVQIDDWNVTPWAQLLVSPAFLVGGTVLMLTLKLGWMAAPGFGLLAAGAGALCGHEYREAADVWPSQRTSVALVAVGSILCLVSVAVIR